MKVVFLDTVHESLNQRLEEAGFTCVDATSATLEEVKVHIKNAHGIVLRSRIKLDKTILSETNMLKFIARSGAGMENIDVKYCEERNIKVFNAPEGNRNAVGEHALGMLLCLFNKIHTANQEIRKGVWNREDNRGIELDGRTVGIIGFGNNGTAFANKLRGFDINVLAYDKYKVGYGSKYVKEVELERLYQECDVVSFHIPQNDETLYFADDKFFNALKKPIHLINLSRGKIVKTSSLVKALKSGKVKGACLDVLEYEKSSFEAFFDQDLDDDFKYLLESQNVILSPHVGGWTQESYIKLSTVLADKILGADL
jgi:D-3-phosphoglycerate dehydrogenase